MMYCCFFVASCSSVCFKMRIDERLKKNKVLKVVVLGNKQVDDASKSLLIDELRNGKRSKLQHPLARKKTPSILFFKTILLCMYNTANSRCANQFYLRTHLMPSNFYFPFLPQPHPNRLILISHSFWHSVAPVRTLPRPVAFIEPQIGISVYRDVIAPHIIVV